jgi:hypothetical protein
MTPLPNQTIPLWSWLQVPALLIPAKLLFLLLLQLLLCNHSMALLLSSLHFLLLLALLLANITQQRYQGLLSLQASKRPFAQVTLLHHIAVLLLLLLLACTHQPCCLSPCFPCSYQTAKLAALQTTYPAYPFPPSSIVLAPDMQSLKPPLLLLLLLPLLLAFPALKPRFSYVHQVAVMQTHCMIAFAPPPCHVSAIAAAV